ncbi:hypothetical protein [Streptococcus cuniculi]|nr:hypothetical protein [Streptococcus cuniculi]MBF0778821.1 hypothetical protein [Streptococcus cuniculi]
MKLSEIAEFVSSVGIALTGIGASLKGLAELIKATKKEPKKTAPARKFK